MERLTTKWEANESLHRLGKETVMDKDTEVLYKVIGTRVSKDTFDALEFLAEKYNRSKSTTIRRLIVERAKEEGFEITKTMEQESW